MRILLALLGAALLSALPVMAQASGHSVVAVCQQTTAGMLATGKSDLHGREYVVSVFNNSAHPVLVPRSPVFSWRVESLQGKEWQLKAEGGPVRRLPHDEHISAQAGAETGREMMALAPGKSLQFRQSIPEIEPLILPGQNLKVTLLWAASPELAKANRDVLRCALAAEWLVNVQKTTR
jgi:hypothetical protein